VTKIIKRTKLQNKSKPIILIGYHVTCAYRVYDPFKEKGVNGRDVIVTENETRD
jgi:hypothetical protein